MNCELLLSQPLIPWSAFRSLHLALREAKRLGLVVQSNPEGKGRRVGGLSALIHIVKDFENGDPILTVPMDLAVSPVLCRMGFYLSYPIGTKKYTREICIWLCETKLWDCWFLRVLSRRNQRLAKSLPRLSPQELAIKISLDQFQLAALGFLIAEWTSGIAKSLYYRRKVSFQSFLSEASYGTTRPNTEAFWLSDLLDLEAHVALTIR